MNLSENFIKKFGSNFNQKVKLSNYSWFNLGGKAEFFFKPKDKNQLIEIGNRTNSYKNIKGQYMGVFKIDPSSWKKIKQYLFKDVKNLNKIDITALFQLIIKKKICNIFVENYEKQWFEIDNIKDYKVLKNSIEK